MQQNIKYPSASEIPDEAQVSKWMKDVKHKKKKKAPEMQKKWL